MFVNFNGEWPPQPEPPATPPEPASIVRERPDLRWSSS